MLLAEGGGWWANLNPWAELPVSAAVAETVLSVPGKACSARDTHFRVSFAASDEQLEAGMPISLEPSRPLRFSDSSSGSTIGNVDSAVARWLQPLLADEKIVVTAVLAHAAAVESFGNAGGSPAPALAPTTAEPLAGPLLLLALTFVRPSC